MPRTLAPHLPLVIQDWSTIHTTRAHPSSPPRVPLPKQSWYFSVPAHVHGRPVHESSSALATKHQCGGPCIQAGANHRRRLLEPLVCARKIPSHYYVICHPPFPGVSTTVCPYPPFYLPHNCLLEQVIDIFNSSETVNCPSIDDTQRHLAPSISTSLTTLTHGRSACRAKPALTSASPCLRRASETHWVHASKSKMEDESCSRGRQIESSVVTLTPAMQQSLHVLPPPAPEVTADMGSVSSWLRSTVRYNRLRRRISFSLPMEGLVQKLRQQTLGSREELGGGSVDDATLASSLRRRDRLMRVLRRRDDAMMDVDQGVITLPEQPTSVTFESGHQNAGQNRPAETTNTSVDNMSNTPLQTEGSSATNSTIPSTTHFTNCATSHHTAIEVDPTEDFSYDFWGADEGYDDAIDDTAWANNRRYLIHSMAKHARSSGALNFRTSSEAALLCPRIVHKAPRMRRRRQRKNQTRLRASSTPTSLCGFDTKSDTATIESCF